MNRAENRLARIRQLVEEAGSLARFAEIVDISPAQAWQVAGKSPVRGIGAKMAARVEQAFGRIPGWLDIPIDEDEPARRVDAADLWPFRLVSRRDYDHLSKDEQRDLDKTVTRFIAGCLAHKKPSAS